MAPPLSQHAITSANNVILHAIEEGTVTFVTSESEDVLAEVDAKLSEIAATHLSNVPGASEMPYAAAMRVISDRPIYDWFADRPDVSLR